MLKRVFFLFILLLSMSNMFAYDVQGYFEPASGKIEEIKEGDFFKGVLRLWPFPHAELEEFQKLEGTDFFRLFTFVEVESFEYSPNNPEVLEVKGTFVLLKAFKKKEFYFWEYRDLNIPIEVRNIVPITNQVQDNKFIVFNQFAEDRERDMKWFFIILIIFIIVAAFISFRLYRKRLKKQELEQKHQEMVNYWKNIFSSAEEREDFERIYKNKKEWIEIVGVKTPPMLDFFRVLETHQYKKSWLDSEKEDVVMSFEQIRGIFQ